MKAHPLTAMSFALYARAQMVPSTSSTTSPTIDCDSAWGSLEANLPTPPPSLSDAWNAAHIFSNGQTVYFTALSQICAFASANIIDDTSLSAAYSTFNVQYYSWYVASSESWKSLVTACPSTAAYGPIEQQTSELDGVLTAYSSFEVAGCHATAAATTTTTTGATAFGTATPTIVLVNSGQREKAGTFGIIAACFGGILAI